MVIAVDARQRSVDGSDGLNNFTSEVLIKLATEHSNDSFIFFAGSKLQLSPPLPNISIVILQPNPTHFLSLKWWYDIQLAWALKKHRADVFIATTGLASLTTTVKQILIIPDLAFLRAGSWPTVKNRHFYKRYTAHSIKKSKKLLTFSNYIKEEVAIQYSVERNSIVAIGGGSNLVYTPVNWEEREAIKEQFAEGWEYFVFTGTLQQHSDFWNVLKAFSIFKKWQRTNLKLLIVATIDPGQEKELEKLNSYKYKSEVILKKDLSLPALRSVVAAAYAMVYPSFNGGFAVPVLNAIQCEVPVITSVNSSMGEICGDAALYVDPLKPEEIAEAMKQIYKDEGLRNRVVQLAKQRRDLFTWNKTAALLWKQIEQTVSE